MVLNENERFFSNIKKKIQILFCYIYIYPQENFIQTELKDIKDKTRNNAFEIRIFLILQFRAHFNFMKMFACESLLSSQKKQLNLKRLKCK